VQDVEGVRAERELEVRADADRDAEAALPRDGHGRAERDDPVERLALRAQAPQCAPARERGRPRGWTARDDDLVPPFPKPPRGSVDVLVDRMRLRPREGVTMQIRRPTP
jgi:hypothetical protein